MVKKDKWRIRTEKELEAYSVGLKELADILTEMNLFWFISCGTLLGAYRNGDLLPWDSDIDVELREEEARSRAGELIRKLKKAGFKTSSSIGKLRQTYRIYAHKHGHQYAIRLWREVDNYRYLGRMRLPAEFFKDNSLSQIEIRGHKYPCPRNIEGYLVWKYGPDWRVPIPGQAGTAHPPNYLLKDEEIPWSEPEIK